MTDSLKERLRARKAFGLNGSTWMMLVEPDADCQEALARIEELEEMLEDMRRRLPYPTLPPGDRACCCPKPMEADSLKERLRAAWRNRWGDGQPMPLLQEALARIEELEATDWHEVYRKTAEKNKRLVAERDEAYEAVIHHYERTDYLEKNNRSLVATIAKLEAKLSAYREAQAKHVGTVALLQGKLDRALREIDDDVLHQRIAQWVVRWRDGMSVGDASDFARDIMKYIKPWGAIVARSILSDLSPDGGKK